MPETGTIADPGVSESDTIQTVGQLRQWLKGFPDDHLVLGAFQGQLGRNLIKCRHAAGHVVIEVLRLDPDFQP
jgi:hypothetical protein